MNRCPITYQICKKGKRYSEDGLKALSRNLKELQPFPFTEKEQIKIASQLASKLSIQGIQPKLSIILNTEQQQFEIVERGGTYILKPPHHLYSELPQNEDLTMRLATIVGIEVPLHGMIYNIDHSLSYFIKRFDRRQKGQKVAVEDFTQLLGFSRETKYDSSMEQVISVLNKFCTFPKLEKLKLFRLIIFNFLVGNEDMHLKNFTLITENNETKLSPAYDLVNTSIVLKTMEEIALPLHGKKSRLKKEDLLQYFGLERLGLSQAMIEEELNSFEKAFSKWQQLISESFLSNVMQDNYIELIEKRRKRLFSNTS